MVKSAAILVEPEREILKKSNASTSRFEMFRKTCNHHRLKQFEFSCYNCWAVIKQQRRTDYNRIYIPKVQIFYQYVTDWTHPRMISGIWVFSGVPKNKREKML